MNKIIFITSFIVFVFLDDLIKKGYLGVKIYNLYKNFLSLNHLFRTFLLIFIFFLFFTVLNITDIYSHQENIYLNSRRRLRGSNFYVW